MTSITEGPVTTSFTYDGRGKRLTRTTSSATHDYVWNYALGLPSISIVTLDGTDLRYYIHTPGGTLLYSIAASDDSRQDYHFDEMGNTLFLTNDAGAVISSYAYSPDGEILSTTGGLDNPFTWQGQYGVMDEGNGLYYVRARYYDSVTGRFISRDPVKSISPMETNPYQYALNNPLRFVDVTGRKSFEEAKLAFAKAKAEVATAEKQYADAEKAYQDARSVEKAAKHNFLKDSDTITGQKHDPHAAGEAYSSSVNASLRAAEKRLAATNHLEEVKRAYDAIEKETRFLKLREMVIKAYKKVNKARKALEKGKQTGAEHDELLRRLRAAEVESEQAEETYEKGGGDLFLDIHLTEIVVLC